MFSKSCEYGIRAVIFIGEKSRQHITVNVKEISQEAEVPEQYLAKILQQLSKQKIISSVKGPRGGFYINEVQKGLKLIELVRSIDGDSLFNGCGLGLKECSEVTPCPLHKHFKKIRTNLKTMLENTSIEMLSADFKKGKGKIKNLNHYKLV